MAKTVVGLFDTLNEAQTVVQQLVDAGFDRNEVSILANDSRGEFSRTNAVGETSSAAEGAGAGAVGGGVLGGVLGLLVGIGALAIPGIGPVLAAGPLAAALGTAGASTLVGAGIGAAAGGVIGALVGAGIPEEDASFYAEGVRRGGTLVMVKTADDMSQRAYDLMRSAGAVDIDKRSTDLRSTGWTGFDANAGAYTGDNAWDRSSKVGTTGGAVAGAATGAAIGAVGGPVGMAIGGVAGAVTGAGVGAAGDAAGEAATESSDDTSSTYRTGSTSVGSSYDADSAAASSTYGTSGATTDSTYGSGRTSNYSDTSSTATGSTSNTTSSNSDSSFYDSTTAGATTSPGMNTSLQNDTPIGARQGQVDYDSSSSTTGSNINTTSGTADRTYGNDTASNWEESSKVGTAGGAVAGAATGAAMGAVGGPVGMAIGGVAGAVTGAGVGAAGDAAGEAAEDSFRGYDDDFRTHYQSYGANSGYTYDQYSPIYRYGYNLANDAAYRDRDWNDIESDARTRWEERNPGTWDRFKDSVRYAWDKARGAR